MTRDRSELQDRMMAAMLAPIVADAAALGSHWVYDLNELNTRYPQGLKGFEQPVEGHYHAKRKPGETTHYGDASRILLISVAENRGMLPSVFTQRLIGQFGSPRYPGFRDHSIRDLLANWEASGKPELDVAVPVERFSSTVDDSGDSVVSVAPVVVAFMGRPDMLQRVDAITMVRQQNANAVAYTQAQALILESLLLGYSMDKAVNTLSQRLPSGAGRDAVLKSIDQAKAAQDQNVIAATKIFGASCPVHKTFPGAFHAWAKNPDNFRACTLAILEAGGDNAARAAIAGAWIGAMQGMKAIPVEWLRKVDPDGALQEQARRVVVTAL